MIKLEDIEKNIIILALEGLEEQMKKHPKADDEIKEQTEEAISHLKYRVESAGKYNTTVDQLVQLRIKLEAGEWIPLQATKLVFPDDNVRFKYMDKMNDEFNEVLDSIGYNGCGLAILNKETMLLTWHEQAVGGKIPELRRDEVIVTCSSWEIALAEAKEIKEYIEEN
jgi:hypothetical protein